MNELREANDEEGVDESDNDGDDALGLEEGITNEFLEFQSEVYDTTIVGEESGRLLECNSIDWTQPPFKTHLGEPELENFDNPGQLIEFTFSQYFQKEAAFTKYMLLPKES